MLYLALYLNRMSGLPSSSKYSATDELAGTSPSLIYISGLAYSGTTLFSAALGQSEGVFNAGEVNYLENDYHENRKCSCGKRVAVCEVWQPTFQAVKCDALTGHKTLEFTTSRKLRPLDSRSLPAWKKLAAFFGVPQTILCGEQELRDYIERHTHLIRAIASVTRSRYVVDASKSQPRLDAFLAYSDLRIKVIYVRRELKQTFASRLKRAKRRNPFYFSGLAPFYMAIIALRIIAMGRQLSRIGREDLSIVDYETFVRDPDKVARQLTSELGVTVDFRIEGDELPLTNLHVYTGNVWLAEAAKSGDSIRIAKAPMQTGLSRFEAWTFGMMSPLCRHLAKNACEN